MERATDPMWNLLLYRAQLMCHLKNYLEYITGCCLKRLQGLGQCTERGEKLQVSGSVIVAWLGKTSACNPREHLPANVDKAELIRPRDWAQ